MMFPGSTVHKLAANRYTASLRWEIETLSKSIGQKKKKNKEDEYRAAAASSAEKKNY